MQTQVARVSIIVPTFNRAHYLGQCLESLIAQTVPAHEIIVVDDGSEDDTASLVAGYVPKVTYLRKTNGGKPSAFRVGLEHASGEVIWLFDDDDVALPQAIETRLYAWQSDPEAGFVYASHQIADDLGDGHLQVVRENQVVDWHPGFFFELLKGCFFHLNSCLIKRELVLALDGLDPVLRASEDYDFQIRLARITRGVCAKEPVFVFRRHTGLRGDKIMRYESEARDRVFREYDAVVGRKLRCSLDLSDYLVPRTNSALTMQQQRLALFSRMLVMASKGCVEEQLEDLAAAVGLCTKVDDLTSVERHLVAESMYVGYSPPAVRYRWPFFYSKISELRSSYAGRSASLALADGLFRLAKSYPGAWSDRFKALGRSLALRCRAYFYSIDAYFR